ncbi:hypothetical protein L1887_31264 [Cichorium endivia]|nr:hypothetical protein L1887_31264 [Cichorium endivia]
MSFVNFLSLSLALLDAQDIYFSNSFPITTHYASQFRFSSTFWERCSTTAPTFSPLKTTSTSPLPVPCLLPFLHTTDLPTIEASERIIPPEPFSFLIDLLFSTCQ